MHAVHVKGKLHRDLKPSNVLVQPDGRVVVLDFGLVKDLAESLNSTDSLELETQVAGSVLYMSPEQAAGRRLTEATDWYSIGVMLFEALTGQVPFSGRGAIERKQNEEAPSPSAFVSDAPEDLVLLATRLLARAPTARPTGKELLAQLSANLEDSPGGFISGPFIGREAHLESLKEAFAVLRQGRSGMVHVFGTSGVGKTVLVRRFLREIREMQGVVVLAGRCHEQESAPYKALDSLIDALTVYLLSLADLECELLLPGKHLCARRGVSRPCPRAAHPARSAAHHRRSCRTPPHCIRDAPRPAATPSDHGGVLSSTLTTYNGATRTAPP